MMRDRRTILGLLGVALFGIAAVPFLLRADDPELALRRQHLAEASEAERQRLQRNFQQFESMDPQQQQHLRDFDTALQEDRINNHGRLSETLNDYADWLKTVTPHQRDALQQEDAPTKRIAMIREIVESQRDERLEASMGGRLEEFLGPIPNLSRRDLAAILEILFQKAPQWVSAQDLQKLQDYPESRRPLKLFELLARSNRTVSELLGETTSRQLLEAISDEQTRRELESVPDTGRGLPASRAQRIKLGRAIQKAVFAELDREYRRRELSQANLKKFFDQLPQDDQDELLTLSPEGFRQELRGRFIESTWTESPVLLTLIRQFFRVQRPGDRPPAGGPRREGRPRPPDRRLPERDQGRG